MKSILLVGLASLTLTSVAFAQPGEIQSGGYGLPQAPPNYQPSGNAASTSYWTSSTGSAVTITSRDSGLSIQVTGRNGVSSTYAGRWLRKYDLFDYNVRGVTYTGQLSGQRVEVTSPNNPVTVWSQVSRPTQPVGNQVSAPTRTAANSWTAYAQGRWRSSSGNFFDINVQGPSLLITAYTSDGRQLNGSGSWIDETTFRYALTGYTGDALATFMSDGRLKVLRDNKVTYWTKQQ